MTDQKALEQAGMSALATMRRAYGSFNQEMAEFGAAAHSINLELMDLARRQAHDYLDAYFDAIASAQAISRENPDPSPKP